MANTRGNRGGGMTGRTGTGSIGQPRTGRSELTVPFTRGQLQKIRPLVEQLPMRERESIGRRIDTALGG